MTDINKLRELAERASGGNWSYSPCVEGQPFFGQVWDAAGDSLCVMDHMTGQANADGDYIAAANPQAILNLIAEVEHLRKDAARYRWLRERDLETIRQGGVFAGMTPENIVLNQEDLDAAIDAALEGATQ
ncbi:hypothetical protein [Pseudomonas aeruginosa]|uniref:hypothetical protein n=1 Tax=Pseudomonas aeruginosa TaxID=287 RepID=UPI000EB60ACA|nr:hypothetical protein [Pseudomonas aeruginosa]MBX5563927.1 hypothetical protein [Pseudomonas aeruginosa]